MKTDIFKSAGTAVSKFGFTIRKHSPEILVVAGVAGTVVSAVMACKATTKATRVLEESKNEIDKVHAVLEDETLSEQYSEEDRKKDLAIIYVQTGVKLAKLYAPAVIVGGLSIASILGGHNILRGRNMALAAAYATIDKSFKEYRGRVVDRFGKDVDYQIQNNLKAEEITEKVVDEETGKTKKIKKTVLVRGDNSNANGYSRLYAAGCANWVNDPNLNRSFLSAAQSFYNDKLNSIGYVFLDDVYNYLGFRVTPESRVVGWTVDGDGDGYIDFGFDQDDAFMSGYNTDVWLSFNVDGPILETFPKSDTSVAVC